MRVRSFRLAALLAAVLVAPALPGLASNPVSDLGRSVVDRLPLAALAGVAETQTVSLADGERLLGVTWQQGQPRVAVRWHSSAGWSPWEVADDDSAVPELAEQAHTVAGTEPMWRPDGADRAQVRVTGTGRGLQLVAVADAATGLGHRLFGLPAAQAAEGRPLLGTVYTRRDWGADDSLRRQAPSYASSVRAVVVHHTDQPGDYGPGDVPQLIRADYAYHVQTRGWNDVGYNLLVDKFGRIWEGRYGGIGRPVVGAQAEGFNTGTLGVALLGDMTRDAPTPAALAALQRVGAFAARTWGFDPLGSVVLTSGGSPRYPAGQQVRLSRIMGHRDTGLTLCPGQTLYDRLGQIRAGAAGLLGPVPRWLGGGVTGSPLAAPGPLDIAVHANRPVAWSVAVLDPAGRHLAEASGNGDVARLHWDGLVTLLGSNGHGVRLPAPAGHYAFVATASDGFHPDRPTYSGTLTVVAPTLTAVPRVLG